MTTTLLFALVLALPQAVSNGAATSPPASRVTGEVTVRAVTAAESVALLEGLAAGGDEEAFGPIALTASPAAMQALDRLLTGKHPVDVRKDAAFWLCMARGEEGFRRVHELVKRDPDGEFRKEAMFALSQSSEPAALPALVAFAKEDRDGEVRAQALFWLAQEAGERALGPIDEALE